MVFKSMMSSMKLLVLCLLCMQNTMFTVLRRYSQGVLKENYSKVRRHTVHAPSLAIHHHCKMKEHGSSHHISVNSIAV